MPLTRLRLVRKRGALGERYAEWKARRSTPDPAGDGLQTLECMPTASQSKLDLEAEQAATGVGLDARVRYTAKRKEKLKYDEDAPLLMAPVIAAVKRFSDAAESEHAFRRRITRIPELLATRSPWLTRIIGGILLCASVVLGASTYSAFAPSREDAVARMLKSVDLDVAWLLGAAQVFGLTVLGYCIAHCLGYAVIAKVRSKDAGPGGEAELEPIVQGTFTRRTYALLAGGGFVFALGVIYAVAQLRGYSMKIDGALSSSAPGSGAAGSLGGGAAPEPAHIGIFLMLCSLELVATIVAFLVLDGPIARVLRGLEGRTNKAAKHLIKVGQRANKTRVRGAWAGMDAGTILAVAEGLSHQARVEAARLEALHRAANLGAYGNGFKPKELTAPRVLPDAPAPEHTGDAPVPYGRGNGPADLLELLREELTRSRSDNGDERPAHLAGAEPSPVMAGIVDYDPELHMPPQLGGPGGDGDAGANGHANGNGNGPAQPGEES